MNLVCRTSKVREKTDLGVWGRTQAQPGDWERLSSCFSQIKEIREKTDFRGRERVHERERGALDYLLVKGLDLVLHIYVLAHCTDYYCFVGVLSKLVRLRFYVDL